MSGHLTATSVPRAVEEGNAANPHRHHGSTSHRSTIMTDIYAAFFEFIGTVESSRARSPVASIDKQMDPRLRSLCSP